MLQLTLEMPFNRHVKYWHPLHDDMWKFSFWNLNSENANSNCTKHCTTSILWGTIKNVIIASCICFSLCTFLVNNILTSSFVIEFGGLRYINNVKRIEICIGRKLFCDKNSIPICIDFIWRSLQLRWVAQQCYRSPGELNTRHWRPQAVSSVKTDTAHSAFQWPTGAVLTRKSTPSQIGFCMKDSLL